MSITSARNFIEKSGCGLIVGVILAVVIIGSLFSGSMCNANREPMSEPAKLIPIARVGNQAVSLQSVDERYRQGAAVLLNVEGGAPPEREAQVYAEALELEIRMTAQRDIAKRRGVQVTKQRILDQFAQQFDSQLAMQRAMLMSTGQLKPGATEAEVSAALNKALGRDVAQARAEQLKQVEQALEDPARRQDLEGTVLGAVLIDSVAGSIQLSDEQLKKDQEIVVTKRIAWVPSKHPGEDLFPRAERVLAEIKAGLSFEAAMGKYSDDPAPPGKTRGESTININRGQISYDDNLKPLASLQPGQVTPVFTLGTGETVIYKVIKFDAKLPANFETTKADLKKTRVREMAIKQIQAEIDALVNSKSLKWESNGFKVLYAWLEATRKPENKKDPAKLQAALKPILEEAEKVAKDPDPIGGRPASLAWFVTLDAIYQRATDAEKSAMRERRVEAATAVLETLENVDLRVEMARMLLDLKKPKEAGESLLAAAQSNAGSSDDAHKRFQAIEGLRGRLVSAGAPKETLDALKEAQDQWKNDAAESLIGDAELNEDYTELGREKYAEINKKRDRYVAAGILDAGQVKKINDFQAKWIKEKEKADAEAAAEKKKQEDEAKKAAEEAKKAADKPAAGSNPPSSSPPKSPSSSDLGGLGKTGG